MNKIQKSILDALGQATATTLEWYGLDGVIYFADKAIMADGEIVPMLEAVKRIGKAARMDMIKKEIDEDQADAAQALAQDVATGVYHNQDNEDRARAKANAEAKAKAEAKAARKAELEKDGWTAEIFTFEAPKPAPVKGRALPKGVILVEVVKGRDRVQFGKTYPGSVLEGTSAEIAPKKSIRLYGVKKNRCKWVDGKQTTYDQPFDLTFKVGDRAEHGSYNLIYTGEILAIGKKTVTIDDHGRKKRLDIYKFASMNWNFDAERISKANAETSHYI
jgi:hypothetical protein